MNITDTLHSMAQDNLQNAVQVAIACNDFANFYNTLNEEQRKSLHPALR